MFYELLNIDIERHIDSASRMGRKGTRRRRPVLIELTNKRVTKYILENTYCLRNTGYAISELLGQEALLEKRKQREYLLQARRDGKHAIIRNEKLYINGEEFYTQDTNNTQLLPLVTQTTPSITTNNTTIDTNDGCTPVPKQDEANTQRNPIRDEQNNSFRD
jgi:hypothetical protein